MRMIKRFLPFLNWFGGYSKTHLRVDALSGLTVALVLIPQSMAYAQLAGLPSFYGLYASFLPPMVAALFGSSRQLATGPVAVVSLMTSASLAPLASAGSAQYIAYAVLLALIVGIFQLLLGILRLGLVVNFLSHPVVNGFTNAAAIIIATSQLSKIFGVSVDNAEHHYETIIRVIESALHYTHWPTVGMAVLSLSIMISLKKLAPRFPNVLVAVVVTTILSVTTGYEQRMEVPLNAIESAAAREHVAAFNAAVSTEPELSKKRSALFDELADHQGDHVGYLDLEHKITLISYDIEELKRAAAEHREFIRSALFNAVEVDGAMRFYLAGEAPAELGTEDRIWRIKVGTQAIDTEAVHMTGGGAVVGTIPRGLPKLTVPTFNLRIALHLLPYAAIISLLGFMEAISIAKAMAAKTGQRLDPNQELIGQGLANILGSSTQSYPTSGSFSRSAVNLQSGAETGLSSVFTSLAVVICLLFFTPLLYHLPQSVLASIIMMAVIGLVNVSGFIHAWRAQWYDGLISVVSFIATLAFAPHLDRGIMIGVVLSLMVFLYKSMRPRVASLARVEDRSLRCSEEHELAECWYMTLIRFDGPLFFANASYLEDTITEHTQAKPRLKHIVIVANGINDIDASGEEVLSLLVDRLRSGGIGISFSGVNENLIRVFKRTHLMSKIGVENIYPTMEEAILANHIETHQDGLEAVCPLLQVCHHGEDLRVLEV